MHQSGAEVNLVKEQLYQCGFVDTLEQMTFPERGAVPEGGRVRGEALRLRGRGGEPQLPADELERLAERLCE